MKGNTFELDFTDEEILYGRKLKRKKSFSSMTHELS